MSGDRYRLAAAAHFKLEVVETHAISYLDTYGPMPQSRLAKLMGLTSGAVTGLVDRLERAGTASRRSDPLDRRRNRIELTEKAREILDASRSGLQRIFDSLEPDVLAAVTVVLPALAENLNREADDLGVGAPGHLRRAAPRDREGNLPEGIPPGDRTARRGRRRGHRPRLHTEIELLVTATDSPVPIYPTTRLHVEAAVVAALDGLPTT